MFHFALAVVVLCTLCSVLRAADEPQRQSVVDASANGSGDVSMERLPPGATGRLGSSRMSVAGMPERMFYSSNGGQLFVESYERLTTLDRETGNPIRDLKNHPGNGRIRFVVPSPDNSMFAVVMQGYPYAAEGVDDRVVVLDPRTTRGQIINIGHHGNSILCMAISWDNSILALAADANDTELEQLQLWDLRTGKRLPKQPKVSDMQACSMTFSPDGKTLVVVGDELSVAWKWQTEERPVEMRHWRENQPEFARFTGDSGKLLIGSRTRKTLSVLEASTREVIWEIPTASCYTRNSAETDISRDGRLVALVGKDADSVEVWDLKLRKCVQTVDSPKSRTLAISPDGRFLAIGTGRNRISQWDLQNKALIPQLPQGHEDLITQLRWSVDGKTLRTFGLDSTCTWDIETAKMTSHISSKQRLANHPLTPFTNAEPCFRGYKTDRGAQIKDLFTNQIVSDLEPARQMGFELALAVSPDRQRVLRFDTDFQFDNVFQLCTFRASTGRLLSRVAIHPLNAKKDDTEASPEFSTKSRFLVFSHGQTLTLIDTATGKELRTATESGLLLAFKFSPDEKWLMAVSFTPPNASDHFHPRRVIITQRSVETLEPVREFSTSVAFIPVMAFSPDSNSFAWFHSEDEGGIEIIDTRTGNTTARLNDVPHCRDIQFGPDGRYLATANGMTDVLLWDLTNRALKP
jgi:WD40 repeat protein